MRQLIVDRFEGKYAICEDQEQKYFAIETGELPEGVQEGCVLEISDEGQLSVNWEETRLRREKMAEKQRRAFGG